MRPLLQIAVYDSSKSRLDDAYRPVRTRTVIAAGPKAPDHQAFRFIEAIPEFFMTVFDHIGKPSGVPAIPIENVSMYWIFVDDEYISRRLFRYVVTQNSH